MTDPSGYAKKSTANGDTRSGLRLRLRIAVPGRAADADPPQHLTCGKFNSRSLVAGFRRILADPLNWPNSGVCGGVAVAGSVEHGQDWSRVLCEFLPGVSEFDAASVRLGFQECGADGVFELVELLGEDGLSDADGNVNLAGTQAGNLGGTHLTS